MRVTQEPGQRGSLKWVQRLINHHAELIDDPLRAALRLADGDAIEWVSPLASDGYAEYRDGAALERLGVTLPKRKLEDFWPARGPQWDALARTRSGKAILVEAKAHVRELISGASAATDPVARGKIDAALTATRQHLGAEVGTDRWMSPFYQYANRLAHLHPLRDLNGIDAHLVFLYFLNDPEMDGPQGVREWEAALVVLHSALGIPRRLDGVHDVFVDVAKLVEAPLSA